MSPAGWRPTLRAGVYLSEDRQHTAELRPAGTYPEGGPLPRHYALRARSSHEVLGLAPSLRSATILLATHKD